jgi:hypothetical protein
MLVSTSQRLNMSVVASPSRCTALCRDPAAGVTLEDRLPPNEYLEYYGPDFRLQPSVPADKPNQNSPEYLEEVAPLPLLHLRWRSDLARVHEAVSASRPSLQPQHCNFVIVWRARKHGLP